jgi:hypothetical protein
VTVGEEPPTVLAAQDRLRQDDPARWLLLRAARDGSTWLPEPVLLAGLGALDVRDPAQVLRAAYADGSLALLDDGVVGLPELALAEQETAEQIERLLLDGELRVRAGPAADGDLRDGHALGLAGLAEALAEVPDGASVVLGGDPDVLQVGPGSPFRDLVASGVVPVEPFAPEPAGPLDVLRAGVRAGRLPAPADLADEARTVVVVPVETDEDAARRAQQLAELSVPRTFGVSPLVVTPLHRGLAGARALAERLPAPVATVAEAASRAADAVVVVLPPSAAGVLTRELVLTALAGAGRHVSIVTGVGAALPRAVATVPVRPRRTRLVTLLREGL